MDIVALHAGGDPARDQYVLGHPQGLAYQLSGYTRAIETAYGFGTCYLGAVSDGRIQGVLSLTGMGLPGFPGQFVSSPYCDAAGILADSRDIEAALLGRGLALARERGAARMVVRSSAPFAGIPPELTLNAGKVRMVLELKSEPEDLLKSLKAKVRSQVKKPVRDGLDFTLGGRELIPQFYRIYAENMRDLGSPPHTLRWFQAVLSACRNRAHIGLVRLPDRTPAAAGIILCHPRTVSIPWASSLRRYNRLNPNMLLYWRFLEFAARQGFRYFDFGRSTPGEGTFRFKAQWGARAVPLHWAVFDPAGRDPHRPLPPGQGGSEGHLRSRAEKAIASLPVSLAGVLGACTRKFISL